MLGVPIASTAPPTWDFESSALTWANHTTVTVAHGLGAVPSSFQAFMRCIAAQPPYAVGDEILLPDFAILVTSDTKVRGATVRADANNFYTYFAEDVPVSDGSTFLIGLDPASWRLILRAKL